VIDWHRLVRAGDQLVCSHMTSEPVALLQSLAESGIAVPFGLMLGVPFTTAAAALPGGVEITTFGGMGSALMLSRSHQLRILVTGYGGCARLYSGIGPERSDIALVSLARSDDGRLWLGAAHGYILAAARRARLVIAEVNDRAPCVAGSAWPEDIAIEQMVESSYVPAQPAEGPANEVEMRIADHVAGLLGNGACLQVGIGSLPSAVLARLSWHRRLGLHSGIFTDALHRLIVAGAMDHSRKPFDTGVAVTGCVHGSEGLYRYCHLNPAVELREPAYTHRLEVIAGLPDFVALNSAIEVDLVGQVNAEVAGRPDGSRRYVGGVGGLNDFARAAVQAPGGQSIVALPSRTSAGRPRVVARLGGPATVAALDADRVVTEHGVASLRHASIEQRVRRMLSVAHPEDREMLQQAAKIQGLI
jgi:acetyl-CoA hydrolase